MKNRAICFSKFSPLFSLPAGDFLEEGEGRWEREHCPARERETQIEIR